MADTPNFGFPDEAEQFETFDDPAFLQYMEDSAYAYLEGNFASDDYIIEDISVVYISQEYLEEVAFNTKANVYFGYTIAELDAAFEGRRYVFTRGEDGTTVVQEFEEFPDNTNEMILRNIAIGTGVILVCVTVSVISGGIAAGAAVTGAATKIHLIFAAAAKTATQLAVGGAILGAAGTAVVKGIETGDMYETVRAAELSASEGFMWGAISGAVSGGAKEAIRIHGITSKAIPTYTQAEQQVTGAYKCADTQVSYLNREKVPLFTRNASRPDGIRYIDGHWEAIEVKRYDLTGKANRYVLESELKRQIGERCLNLPSDMTQRIVLNVEGRGYTQAFMEETVNWIHSFLDPIYPDIPVDVFGGVL
ncbi:MAG: hypothetical protein ACOYI8_00070 [Christensenellales bacterium]